MAEMQWCAVNSSVECVARGVYEWIAGVGVGIQVQDGRPAHGQMRVF